MQPQGWTNATAPSSSAQAQSGSSAEPESSRPPARVDTSTPRRLRSTAWVHVDGECGVAQRRRTQTPQACGVVLAVLSNTVDDGVGVAPGEVRFCPVVVDRHGADNLHVDPRGIHHGEALGGVEGCAEEGLDLGMARCRRARANRTRLRRPGRREARAQRQPWLLPPRRGRARGRRSWDWSWRLRRRGCSVRKLASSIAGRARASTSGSVDE